MLVRMRRRGGVMLQVIEHPVHLVEHALLGILVLDAQLIAVGLADGAGLIRPVRPRCGQMRSWTLLDFFCQIHRSSSTALLQVGAAQGQDGKLLLQIVAVDDAEFFDGVGGRAVLPVGTDGAGRSSQHAVFEDVAAVVRERPDRRSSWARPHFVWQPAARTAASASSSVGSTLG